MGFVIGIHYTAGNYVCIFLFKTNKQTWVNNVICTFEDTISFSAQHINEERQTKDFWLQTLGI